uniref:Uncharacterized protein n=1 Tax=Arundo donax TaxID=35708 RepID=A0A0A9GJ05_ARUDO
MNQPCHAGVVREYCAHPKKNDRYRNNIQGLFRTVMHQKCRSCVT